MRENPSGSTRATMLDLAELPFERYRDSDNLVERLNLPNTDPHAGSAGILPAMPPRWRRSQGHPPTPKHEYPYFPLGV